MHNEIAILEKQIDGKEQYLRRNCILLHGIPECKGEVTDDAAVKKICQIAYKLSYCKQFWYSHQKNFCLQCNYLKYKFKLNVYNECIEMLKKIQASLLLINFIQCRTTLPP